MRPRQAAPLALAALTLVLAACGSASAAPPPPPASFGLVQDRPVPQVPLLDTSSRPTSLAAFRGKVVVLAPFLSLCQDECPLITGAFLTMQRSVAAAGLADKVEFVEVTLDPGRDTPARLAAYSAEFGAHWPLLTGTPQNLDTLWHFFGIYHQIVPEESPPKLDWWTHTPLTYDVDHSDGFILLGPDGHERFITTSPPDLAGHLDPKLKSLLNDGGLHNLDRQGRPNWTVGQALDAVSWLVGRKIPLVGPVGS
jgi:cytochrome oxidase Cu insertion factor (SCO1/SenC/PrrC family)